MFEQLLSELKKNFDPSLEKSWYKLFGIIIAHGPKNQPPSSPGVEKEPPYYVFSKDAIFGSVPSISSEVLALIIYTIVLCSITKSFINSPFTFTRFVGLGRISGPR